MGRVVFRLSLLTLAALTALFFLWPEAEDRIAPQDPVAAPPTSPEDAPPMEQQVNKAGKEPALPAAPPPGAEAARLPLRYEEETAVERLHPPPPPEPSPAQETQRFFRVLVTSSEILKADDIAIRLQGIDGPEPDETCPAAQGDAWPCGRMARAALSRLIRTRAVECRFEGSDPDGARLGRCTVAGTDINEWMVRRGWARAEANSTYAEALQAAKEEGNGLWSKGGAQP